MRWMHAAVCALGIFSCLPAGRASASIAATDPYGVFTFGDLTTNTSIYNVDVAAGGNVNSSTTTFNNNVVAGGTISGGVTTTFGGPVASGNPSSPVNFASIASTLAGESSGWSGLATNGSISSGVGTLSLSGLAANTIYVFNVTESEWEGANTSRNINLGSGSSAIINIPGTDIDMASGLSYAGSANSQNVLQNYFAAATVDFSIASLQGTFLAPSALTTISVVDWTGKLISNTANVRVSEFFGPTEFLGALPDVAPPSPAELGLPEAASIVIWGLGAAVTGLGIRFKRRCAAV